jgi:hypothetical protein
MSIKAPTQAERVAYYMTRFGSITRAEALMDLGIANLPAVIDKMRHKYDMNIITEEVKGLNRFEEKITYARYRFDESEDTASGN